jgi:hypothetical protein
MKKECIPGITFAAGVAGGSLFAAIALHSSLPELAGLAALGLLAGFIFCRAAGSDWKLLQDAEEYAPESIDLQHTTDYEAGYANGYRDGTDDMADTIQFTHPEKPARRKGTQNRRKGA